MTIIVDRRSQNKNKSVSNRKRFVNRYKHVVKRAVDKIAKDKNLKDFFKDDEISIDHKTVQEPTFRHKPGTGTKDHVIPGNEYYDKNDTIAKPNGGASSGKKGSDSGGGEDDFTFTLTKEEFLEIYFKNMELPNFIKESINKSLSYKRKKAGYSKYGIPARLSIKKTFEQAIARRIATRGQNKNKKPRYLDDIDIRYDYYVKEPKPVKHAVMFCLMDVSGSMGAHEKMLAKKFFLLLYLFLHKDYETIELVFIRHTTVAAEVDEETFFYSTETGGTIVSSALILTDTLITQRYNIEETNIYIAQASDGGNWDSDNTYSAKIIIERLLPKVQYFAYIQTEPQRNYSSEHGDYGTLYSEYKRISETHNKVNVAVVADESQVYPVLQELFKKG